MREVTADPALVACCGLYCGACGSFLKEKCEGCQKSGKNSWCQVKKCANKKGISTCAQCLEYPNPSDCKKFNNFISKIFGFILKSDRPACLREIRASNLQAYAEKMAGLKQHSIRRS
jgi:hypothetical protein